MGEKIRGTRAESQREDVHRTLLVFPGAVGDLMLLAPAVHAVASTGTRIETSVARALASFAVRLLPGAAGPPVDGAAMSGLFGGAVAPALARWLAGADVVHLWLGRTRDPGDLVARVRAFGAGTVEVHRVHREDGDAHASLAYARDLGVAVGAPVTLALAAEAVPWSWTVAPDRRLVVHPGAGARAKRWSMDGFARVADAWRAAGGEAVVLLGPAEDDLVSWWRDRGHAVVTGRELLAAAALVASAGWYVGNDAGMSHVAGALGRSGVVLFGPTRPERWRPLGGRLAVVRFTGVDDEACANAVGAHLRGPAYLDTPSFGH